ncbi:AMP-binding protein [Streptomyces sp. PRh5]|uniref:AMP-binding protein n=1 Tax=Streptomyces sp. PRh5 TaxID=1158056 RepID=UPI001F5269A5|nr:AMP-binding protein [Streptomyces sp. PRh5]
MDRYGLSETSPVASFNPPDRPHKAGSIGLPIRGVEFMLVADDGTTAGRGDVGEIAIRGVNPGEIATVEPPVPDRLRGRLRQTAGCRLQVPADRHGHGRAPQGSNRQDPQTGNRREGVGDR